MQNDSYTSVAGSVEFSVVTESGTHIAKSWVEPTQSGCSEGDYVTVNFGRGASGAKDWIGIYGPGLDYLCNGGENCNSADDPWVYVDGTQIGTTGYSEGFNLQMLNSNTLAPGTYEARFFFNDSYNLEVSSQPFTVVSGGDMGGDVSLEIQERF
jgi:hypothetical protein